MVDSYRLPTMPANDEYEVDECHLFTRKNERGRILRSQSFWVVGIINR
jgi:hypothetical protein